MRGTRRAARGIAALLIALAVTLAAITPALAQPQMKTVRTASLAAQEQFFSTDERTGVRSGYAYKFLTDIGDLAGWDYEYTECGWSEAMDLLLDGQIDVMAEVSYTDERAERMLFSAQPMCTESYYLYVAPDSPITDESELDGHTIAVARGAVEADMLQDHLAQAGMDCTIVTFDSEVQIAQILESGTADAFVGVNIQSDKGYVPLALVGQSDCYFAINKDRPDLKREIDAAMAQLFEADPYYILRLSRQYMDNSRMMRTPSPEERAWLEQKGTLRIGYVTGCMPYSSTDADGSVIGVLADAASTIEKNFSVTVECVAYQDSEVLAADLKAGAVDAAFGITDNEWVSDTNGLSLCEPLAEDTSSVVYAGEYADCLNGTLAITRANSFDLPCYQCSLPGATFVVYDTAEKCLDAVLAGEADGFVDHSGNVYSAVGGSARYARLRIAGMSRRCGICFVVAKGNPTLYTILNRLNACYTDAQIEDLVTAYSASERTVTLVDFVTYNAIPVVVGTILVSIGVIAAILAVSRNTNRLKTLSFTDQLTGLGNRSAYERDRRRLAESPRGSLGVAFADVNGLKESNDSKGHKAGDELIVTSVGYLTGCFPGKHVYRIGGDEFVVLFPDCDRESFESAFGQLRDLSGEKNGGILSVGMAWDGAGYDIQGLTTTAERRMYEMKRDHYSRQDRDRREARH